MHSDNFQEPEDQFNDEASMAKADLYKLGKYSVKLIKMIHDGQELEGWVQAKITKAADYVASVFHYMEYELKASEYGEQLDNADVYEEHIRARFAKKLMEAKVNLKKVSVKEQDKMKKEQDSVIKDTNESRLNDEGCIGEGCVMETTYDEVEHPRMGRIILANHGGTYIIGADKEGQPFKILALSSDYKKIRQQWEKLRQRMAQLESIDQVYAVLQEASKPSAGMSKKQKSTVVKKAKAGGDIGKPGKGFEKVEKAAKKSGASNPVAIAASSMWKAQAKKAKKG